MAYIPDEAITRRNELTSGAYALYTHLCVFRCRQKGNPNYGLSFPSQQTLMKETGFSRTYLSGLISELVKKQWIAKEGWKIRLLAGFTYQPELSETERRPRSLKP